LVIKVRNVTLKIYEFALVISISFPLISSRHNPIHFPIFPQIHRYLRTISSCFFKFFRYFIQLCTIYSTISANILFLLLLSVIFTLAFIKIRNLLYDILLYYFILNNTLKYISTKDNPNLG